MRPEKMALDSHHRQRRRRVAPHPRYPGSAVCTRSNCSLRVRLVSYGLNAVRSGPLGHGNMGRQENEFASRVGWVF